MVHGVDDTSSKQPNEAILTAVTFRDQNLSEDRQHAEGDLCLDDSAYCFHLVLIELFYIPTDQSPKVPRPPSDLHVVSSVTQRCIDALSSAFVKGLQGPSSRSYSGIDCDII